VAFGGAGGLHVCELADDLEMTQILAPVQAGVLSALGMLVSSAGRQLTLTMARLLSECSDAEIAAGLEELAESGRASLAREGVDSELLTFSPALDLCYRGQAWPLTVPWTDRIICAQQFQATHEQRYGHRLDAPVEVINLRMGVHAPGITLPLPELVSNLDGRCEEGRVYGCLEPVPIMRRMHIPIDVYTSGPFIVCDIEATSYIAPGWQCRRDKYGNLMLTRQR